MADLGKQFLDTDGLNALWAKHKKVQPFYQEIGTSGTNGWVNFLTVKGTTYMNHPLVVRLLCRGYSDSTMDVQFVSANNKTPTIQYFKQRIQPYSGTQAIAKPGYTYEDVDGVRYYKFWLKKNEGYGAIGVHVESEYFYINGADDTGILTFPNVQSDTEPSGIEYVKDVDIVYEAVPAKTAVSAAAVKVGTNVMGQVVIGDTLAPSDLGISATTTSVTVGSTTANIPQATSTSPKMDGTAAVGTETTWAKGDHVHPTDTSRAPTSHASSATTYGIGTTSNYGHVKLATGDMNGATHADGVAVSKNHTHSQYVPTTRTVNGHALSSDVTVTASDISAVRYDTASQGLTDTQKSNARTNIGAGTSNLTIGTTATMAAAGNHTHTTTLATDSGTATVELAHATTYKLTAGDTSVIFKTPSDNNTDTKVKATAKTDNANYKILATASASPTSGNATEAVYDADISLNPSTNTISANVSGTSASAGKLTTARKTYVTLGTASTTTTRDWSGDTTIPVNGTLGIGNGGTGATDAAGARTNLAVYSKTEVDSMLSGRISVVASLPSTGEDGVIYYVGPTGSGSDQYDEYIWSNNAFVKVGEHSLDLSNYVNTVTTSGSGSVVTGVSKSNNTVTVTKGNIAINNLSDWASNSDVSVGGVTYHTWWPTSPTSSNQVYGLSIYNGKLYQVYNNKGTYSVRSYDQDNNTTYTNEKLGQGYGTCSTAQATAEKAVTLSGYELTKGGIVAVKFTNALCASATLNINTKGAKPVYINGAAVTSTNASTVAAGDTAYFMYDGTAYHLLGTDRAAGNPIANITRSGTTFTATRLDGTTFTFTQQDNNTTYTQEKLGQGYGTCTTAEATAAKVVSLTNYELVKNGVVAVKFSYNLCAAATLNINSKGAKPVYVGGAAVTSSNCKVVQAGDLAFFIYDDTAYHFICTDRIAKTGITGLSVSGKTVTYTKADGSTGTFDTQDTTYVFDGTYNASSNKAATVATVTNAINALDVSDISGFGAGKTLATLTETNGKIAATFQNISITKSQVSDFSHTHGNIQNGGTLQTTDITIADGDKLVVTDASDSNKVARASLTFDGATTNQMLSKKGEWSDTIAKARAVVDYGATSKAIEIGWSGAAVTSPAYFAVYTDSANGYNKAIKDCSLANVKKVVNGTSKGSSTQPTYIDANGVPTAIDYTIESNVPSGAVFTDTKQNITLATTTKAFITGVSTTPTSTAQALTGLADTGVYLTTTAGELNATQYKVNEHCTMKYNSTKSSLDFTFS